MKKFIWLGIGVAVGVYLTRKISSGAAMVGPEGLNRAVGRLSDSIAQFGDAIREGMNERESELRAALGVDTAKDQALDITFQRSTQRR